MKKIMISAMMVLAMIASPIAEVSAQGQRGGARDRNKVENGSRGNRRPSGNKVSSDNKHNGLRPGGGNQNGNHNGLRPGGGNHNDNHNGLRPGGGNQNGNHNGLRPGGGNHSGNHNGLRPGGGNHNGNHNGLRPGGGNHNGLRPGGGKPGNGRPGVGNRPGNSHGWHPGGPAHVPVLRPGVSRPPVMSRPHRPGLAPSRPFYRPVPPAAWRPARRISLWSDILGITVGMTVNTAIDRLLYGGYTIDGYGSNEVYLRNVPQFNFYWPDATMYYGPGGFIGSRFFYSTIGYDMSRYRDVYNVLCGRFGMPVNVNGSEVTWYGTGNQYVTLDFTASFTDAGQRYFTTLSIGV